MSIRVLFWLVLLAATAVYTVMLAVTLPAISASAGGLVPFDLRPTGYSEAEARAFLAALSDEGRALYLGRQHLLDTAYPVLLALTLGLAMWRLTGRRDRLIRALCLPVPVLAGAADLWENLNVRGLLLAEAPTAEAIAAASQATQVKSALVPLSLLLLLVLAVRAALKRRARRRKAAPKS